MKHTIDAQGKKIGRVASEAAAVLLGKDSPSFAKNKVAERQVEIVNAGKADVIAKKKQDDVYVTYTGHRGGLNKETLGNLIARRGMKEVFRRAVYRMLPSRPPHEESNHQGITWRRPPNQSINISKPSAAARPPWPASGSFQPKRRATK
jgi:large subunit ribosomal protein L13